MGLSRGVLGEETRSDLQVKQITGQWCGGETVDGARRQREQDPDGK